MMRTKAIFDDIAHQYDDNRGGEPRGQRFAEKVIPFLPRDAKVLEIGVGTGVIAGAVQAAGFDVTGLDVSGEMLKRAVGRVHHLVWADMNRLPFLDRYFGGAYAVWVSHLAADLPDFLRDVRRVLRTGGCFLNCSAANSSVPSEESAAARAIAQIIWEMQSELSGEELVLDSPSRLADLASASGFVLETVVDIRHEYTTSANLVAKHLEARGMSTLQQASPEQQARVIVPAIAKLRALPSGETEVRRRTRHQFTVLRAV